MAFDPLQTDEKLDKGIKKQPDFDSQMLAGCTAFVGTSVLSYLLAVWPFFILPDMNRVVVLAADFGLGFVPFAGLGIYSTRKAALPGACGFLGGALATAVFLSLRLQQVMLGLKLRDLPQPEYPPSFVWLVPVAWLLLTLCIIAIFLQKGGLSDEPQEQANR